MLTLTNKASSAPAHAIISGTIIDRPILGGEYFVFRFPVTATQMAEIIAYYHGGESEDRMYVKSWAEIDGEEEVWRPCGIEVRFASGRKPSLESPKNQSTIDALPVVLTVLFNGQPPSPDSLAEEINAQLVRQMTSDASTICLSTGSPMAAAPQR